MSDTEQRVRVELLLASPPTSKGKKILEMIEQIINKFPAEESIEKLREFNVSYVVLHGEKVNDDKVKLLKSVDDVHVYKIV